MTHTLHRFGPVETLKDDYVIFTMTAKGINEEGSIPKIEKFFEVLLKYDPINYGEVMAGNRTITSVEKINKSFNISSVPHGVFTSSKQVEAVLSDLKRRDLGLSVVVSGLILEVDKCCNSIGLEPHTIEHSLGFWGNKGMLPVSDVLQIITMCGHSMVSPRLVDREIERVRRGKTTAEEAASTLSRPCRCGIFNPQRAALLIRKIVEKGK